MADAPDTAQLHAAFEAWYEKEHGIEWGDFATAPGGNYSKPRISVAFSAYRAGKAATPSPPVAAPPATPVAPTEAEVLAAAKNWGRVERYHRTDGKGMENRIVFEVHQRAAHFAVQLLRPQPQPAQPLTDKDLDAEIERLSALKKERATAFFEARIGLPCSQCGDGKYQADGNGYSQFHRCDKCHHVPMWNGDSEWLAPGITAPSTPAPPEVAQ